VNAALYATIWLALALFVAGAAAEHGSARTETWGRRAWALGAPLCVLHMLVALGTRHGWSQAHAAAEIARRSAEVYGWRWSGAIWVNYSFATLWSAETAWRGLRPAAYARRPRALAWTLRGFYLVVVVNAAIVFASPAGRVVGVPLVAWLVWSWRPARRTRVALDEA